MITLTILPSIRMSLASILLASSKSFACKTPFSDFFNLSISSVFVKSVPPFRTSSGGGEHVQPSVA